MRAAAAGRCGCACPPAEGAARWRVRRRFLRFYFVSTLSSSASFGAERVAPSGGAFRSVAVPGTAVLRARRRPAFTRSECVLEQDAQHGAYVIPNSYAQAATGRSKACFELRVDNLPRKIVDLPIGQVLARGAVAAVLLAAHASASSQCAIRWPSWFSINGIMPDLFPVSRTVFPGPPSVVRSRPSVPAAASRRSAHLDVAFFGCRNRLGIDSVALVAFFDPVQRRRWFPGPWRPGCRRHLFVRSRIRQPVLHADVVTAVGT